MAKEKKAKKAQETPVVQTPAEAENTTLDFSQPTEGTAPAAEKPATPAKQQKKKMLDNYVVCFILSILAIAIGICMLLVDIKGTMLGEFVLNYIVAAALLVYCFTFLINKITRARSKTVRSLEIAEFVVMLLIAVGLIAKEFLPKFPLETIQILGLGLWLRGVVEMVSAYKYHGEKDGEYTLGQLMVNIVILSLGVYIFDKGDTITDKRISQIVAIILMAVGVVLLILAIVNWRRQNAKVLAENKEKRKIREAAAAKERAEKKALAEEEAKKQRELDRIREEQEKQDALVAKETERLKQEQEKTKKTLERSGVTVVQTTSASFIPLNTNPPASPYAPPATPYAPPQAVPPATTEGEMIDFSQLDEIKPVAPDAPQKKKKTTKK